MFQKSSGGGDTPGPDIISEEESEIHMFDSCDFVENFAALGGGLYFSTDKLQVNFGAGCNFTNNAASEMGGVLYIEASSGSRGVRLRALQVQGLF